MLKLYIFIFHIYNYFLFSFYIKMPITGEEVEKDMADANYTDEFDPYNYQSEFFSGMADFIDDNIVAGDKDEANRLNASYWSDLGNDVFDDWGYFYLYDVSSAKYYFPLINPQNQDDGVITTQTFNAFGRTFTIIHGWVAQGIFKFDISVNDDLQFRFGAYGNMGSDGDEDQYYLSTVYGAEQTLYYHHHAEMGDTQEILYSYFVPKNASENASRPFDVYYNIESIVDGVTTYGDDMGMVSKPLTSGLTVYYSKTNDVHEWVIEDLVGTDTIDNEVFNAVILNLGFSAGVTTIINQQLITSMLTELGVNGLTISKIAGQLMNDLLKNKFNL